MSKILEVRKKLDATKRIGRVTNAMQLVSVSRFHQSFLKTQASRPYCQKMLEVLQCISEETLEELGHPFLSTEKKSFVSGMILLGSQKGLCGSLNQRVFKACLEKQQSMGGGKKKHCLYWTHGERMRSLLRSVGVEEVGHTSGEVDDDTVFAPLFDCINQFKAGLIDSVYVCYSDYISLMEQKPKVLQLLPIPKHKRSWTERQHNPLFEWEPNVYKVADFLLTQYVRALFYQAVLESKSSEHASRMVAMKTATDNAGRIQEQTQLLYNNVRQAQITQEIIEIVSGADQS